MNRNTSQKAFLPRCNPTEDLETISRNKLSLLFTPSLFEVRNELQRDKGIDFIVELKQDSTYTNFRFAIQLKSTASAKANKDQSFSYSVDVANINYLLNYGMPAYYILYDHATDIFYFEQVHKVFQALIKKYPPEKFPNQFKINFSKHLTSETIKEIYQTTLENGVLLRQLNAHLSLSTTPGIIIDDEKDVYSVEQNLAFIDQYGFLLLNRAEHKRIIEIEQRTHPRKVTSPIFNLVCGVAYFQQGSLFKAIDFLKAAQNEASAFEPSIRSTLTYTFLQVKRLLGLINEADFKKGTSELMQQEGLGSFLELQKAFAKFLESKEKDEIRIKKLQNKILSLISKEPDNINLRIRAYSIILSIEQKQLLHNLALNFVMLCGRVPNLLATNTYKKWKELEDRHGKRLGLLLKYSLDTKQLLGFSNIAMEISDWSFQKLYTLFILKNWNANTLTVKSTPSLEELVILDREMERIDSIINGYEMLEHKENLVQALILKYEVLVFAGRKDEAPAVASQIASLIEKHDMNALKLDYQAMLNGCSRFKKFLTSFTNHMHNIYTVAKNSGIGKYFKQQIPPEYLESTEFLEKAEKWMVVDFFEMEFPLLNKHSEYETEC